MTNWDTYRHVWLNKYLKFIIFLASVSRTRSWSCHILCGDRSNFPTYSWFFGSRTWEVGSKWWKCFLWATENVSFIISWVVKSLAKYLWLFWRYCLHILNQNISNCCCLLYFCSLILVKIFLKVVVAFMLISVKTLVVDSSNWLSLHLVVGPLWQSLETVCWNFRRCFVSYWMSLDLQNTVLQVKEYWYTLCNSRKDYIQSLKHQRYINFNVF